MILNKSSPDENPFLDENIRSDSYLTFVPELCKSCHHRAVATDL